MKKYKLRTFERRIIKHVYGPLSANRTINISSNLESNQILKGKDLVRHVKSLILNWLSHWSRMEHNITLRYFRKNEIIRIRTERKRVKDGYKNVETRLRAMGINIPYVNR